MNAQILVLIPPILVLILAQATRNVLVSLLCGIMTAGLIACDFSPICSIILIGKRFLDQTNIPDIIYQTGSYDKLYMMGFLLTLGILIELMTHTGSLSLYTRALLKKVKSSRAAQYTSLMLSTCCFIDDYLNGLLVGSIMRPITDHFAIPRAKLAYLLNAMSGSLCLLIPATSWVAMILTQLSAIGVQSTATNNTLITVAPFILYIATIPFLLYPVLSIVSAWFIVSRNISFGLLHKQEKIAEQTGNLFGGKEPIAQRSEPKPEIHGSITDIIFTLTTFIFVTFIALTITGQWHMFGGEQPLTTALMQGKSNFALFIGILSATLVNAFLAIIKGHSKLTNLMVLAYQGCMLMKNSVFVLLFAWCLSTLLQDDLQTGKYIADLLLGSVPLAMLPAIVFLTSTLVSASTGSAWGTIMFLMPLALPLIATFAGTPPLDASYLFFLAPVLGALLSGAVAGGHLSPITDATVVASTSAGAYHLDHVQSQAAYSMPALIGTTCGFMLLGFLGSTTLWTLLCAFGLALTLCLGILVLRNRRQRA